MAGEHAPLPPSGAPIWGRCSAAPVVSAGIPEPDRPEALEGNAAHWVVSEILLNYRDGQTRNGPVMPSAFIGKQAPNGVIIDEKITEGAGVMVRNVMDIVGKGHIQKLCIEHRVRMPGIHPENWGTLDVSLFIPEKRVLYIWDYKHGHRERKAEGDLQLVDYAEGRRQELNINGLEDQSVTLVFRIVQPFCYRSRGPYDEWVGKLSDIRGWVNILRDKAHEVFTNPQMTTGLHCRDCLGKLVCSARRKADYNMVDLANEPYQIDKMGDRDLSVERQILKDGLAAAEKRLEAIEDELVHRLRDGAKDTGLALEAGYGNLKWTVPDMQAEALAGQFGFSIKTDAVKTPRQAVLAAPEKVRPMFEQTIKTVTKRPTGKLKLVNAGETIGARAFKQPRSDTNATV